MIEHLKKYVAVICVLYLCFCVSFQIEFIFDPDAEEPKSWRPPVKVASVELKPDGLPKPGSWKREVKDTGGGGKPAFVSADTNGPRTLELSVRQDGLQLSGGLDAKWQHIIIASVCGAVALVGIVIAVTCYCKFRRSESTNFAAQRHDNGYATYGVTGPVSKSGFHFHEPGDRKLAQSAQMYHYQYQKQQMIDMEKAGGEVKADATDEDAEAEDEDDVVYQTCGLASSTDLQIPNPMFKGEDGSKPSDDDPQSGR